MRITTKRLTIRELTAEDWRNMQRIALDFGKSEYRIYDIPLPTEDTEIKALTDRFVQSGLFFAVLLEETMIRYICFHEDSGNYDLGYCFLSEYQGKGYAYEACVAAMAYMTETADVKAFTAGTALDNLPSCKLLRKLGFDLRKTETLSFHQDENGKDITFLGGVFVKEVNHYDR